MIERVFGWIFVAVGLMGLVGVVGCGAWWHWFTVVMCAVIAWCCFNDTEKAGRR